MEKARDMEEQMINIKSKKGITIVSLVIAIVILLILSGTTIYNLNLSNGVSRYNNMIADIKLLNDKALIYFNKYGEIPKTDRKIEIKNNEEYYEVDLSKLEGITLNYGKDYGQEGNLTNSSDVYVINSNLNVYYLKGVEKAGEMYHEK